MDKALERRTQTRQRKLRSESRLRMIRYLLAAVAIFLAANIFFEISDIQVEGNVIYSSSEITEASGLKPGDSGLMSLRSIASRRIRSSLPGISAAHISLVVPDRMVITVKETSAVAVLKTEQGTLLLSQDCKAVSGFRGDEGELLQIRGITPLETQVGQTLQVSDAESTKLSYLREMLTLLSEKEMRLDVQELDFSNVSDLHFRYLDRFNVRMGRQEKLENKLDLLKRIVGNLGAGDRGTLDMSTPQEGHYFPG